MGAWGVGMQASDDALDGIAVAKVRKSEDPEKDDYEKPKPRLNVRAALDRVFRARYTRNDQAALGVAEWLLDAGVDVTPARTLIVEAIDRELRRDRLDCWVDNKLRKQALTLFRKRVLGEPLTTREQKAVARDNRGLLTRIGEMTSRRLSGQ